MDKLLASFYHAHHSLHTEDIPFWLQLAQEKGSPILELGCGTGRVLFPLAQAGFRTFGFDRDWAMLAFLKSNLAPDLDPQPLVFQADMADFCMGLRFPLILLSCNTLSTLPPATRRACFANIRRHLQPGGIFVSSLPNPVLLADLEEEGETEEEDIFYHPITGNPVLVSSAWRRTRQAFNLTWHYDHLLPDGRVERFSLASSHSLDLPEIYMTELSAAGLRIVDRLGDFDGSSYSKDSPSLILLARLA